MWGTKSLLSSNQPSNKLMASIKQPSEKVVRALCNRCHRPPKVCVCSVLSSELPIRTRTRVIILQHPREFKRKTVGTVPLVNLILGPSCETIVCPWKGKDMGNHFSEHPSVMKAASSNRSLLLFPALHHQDELDKVVKSLVTNLEDGDHESLWGNGEGGTLIVIDGSWCQAKVIFKSAHILHSVPRVQLSTEGLGEYGQLRKEPKGNFMSTLEAVAHALHFLEENTIGRYGLEKGSSTGRTDVVGALIAAQRELVRCQKFEINNDTKAVEKGMEKLSA